MCNYITNADMGSRTSLEGQIQTPHDIDRCMQRGGENSGLRQNDNAHSSEYIAYSCATPTRMWHSSPASLA
ncbi:hypothetical protein V2G26_020651 [Clonostachys chloroleuca]